MIIMIVFVMILLMLAGHYRYLWLVFWYNRKTSAGHFPVDYWSQLVINSKWWFRCMMFTEDELALWESLKNGGWKTTYWEGNCSVAMLHFRRVSCNVLHFGVQINPNNRGLLSPVCKSQDTCALLSRDKCSCPHVTTSHILPCPQEAHVVSQFCFFHFIWPENTNIMCRCLAWTWIHWTRTLSYWNESCLLMVFQQRVAILQQWRHMPATPL